MREIEIQIFWKHKRASRSGRKRVSRAMYLFQPPRRMQSRERVFLQAHIRNLSTNPEIESFLHTTLATLTHIHSFLTLPPSSALRLRNLFLRIPHNPAFLHIPRKVMLMAGVEVFSWSQPAKMTTGAGLVLKSYQCIDLHFIWTVDLTRMFLKKPRNDSITPLSFAQITRQFK